MRNLLRTKLEAGNSGRKWNHITEQIGMFCYTGLSKEQVIEILFGVCYAINFVSFRWLVYRKSIISTAQRMVAFRWLESILKTSTTLPAQF